MSKQAVVTAFRKHCAPALKAMGFSGPRGHFVRRVGEVTQVIEIQHSIYGGRLTANLGLDLEWLLPQVRWIPRPTLGPHAHDATRWIRVGIASPARSDIWWSYDEGPESIDEACHHLARAVLEYGLPWLEDQSNHDAFAEYAEAKLELSKSDRRPEGSFLELRLRAAVCAWNGDFERAQVLANHAAEQWAEEKSRLSAARKVYRDRHPSETRLVGVPNLLRELERIISPTTGARAFLPRAGEPRRRSKSSR